MNQNFNQQMTPSPSANRPMEQNNDMASQTPSTVFPRRNNMENAPEVVTNPLFTAGYLRENIGRLMRVEFLIGNNVNDRVGRLVDVGASYIVLQPIDQASIIMCDIYSIKFATIISDGTNVTELF